MRKTIALVVLISSALLGVSCAVMDGSGDSQGVRGDNLIGDFARADVLGNVDVVSASLVGEIGSVRGLTHYATAVNSYSDGAWASFHVIVDKGDGAAMAIVDVWDLSSLGLNQGNTQADQRISIVGCSGPEPGTWDFDAGAEDVDYDVREDPTNPDLITLDFRGEILDYSEFYYPDSDGWATSTPEQQDSVPRRVITGSITFVRPTDLDPSEFNQPVQPDADPTL